MKEPPPAARQAQKPSALRRPGVRVLSLGRPDPLGWWRRHFPVRLAVTTAALLAVVMAGVLASTYAAVASLLVRRLDARALAAAEAGRLPPPARFEAGPVPGAAVAPRLPQAAREPAFDEEEWPLEARERRRGDAEREEVLERARTWEWSIHAGAPGGPRRSSLAWLWPSPGDVRVGRPPGAQGPAVVEDLEELAETLAGLRRWLAGLGAAGTVLVSGVAFVSARRAFAPLRAMTEAAARVADARRISPETLDVQVPPAVGDATLERLARLFNAMLARVRDALLAQARFVDDASHELRTPLGALRADLEVALREWPEPGPCRAVVERSLQQVVRLSRLADDLLALARYERGGLIRPRPGTDVAAAVRQALSDTRHLAERSGAMVVADLPPALPMTCDGPALTRVAVNLLKNAIEASPPGATVHVRLSRRDDGVWLEVADSGPGMKPEDAARAFEPFFRGTPGRAGPHAEEAGSGLGLAIVKAVVQAHGGEVSLKTAPGRGSVVGVRLPVPPPDPGGPGA